METPHVDDKILSTYKNTDEKKLKKEFLANSYTPWKRAMDLFNGTFFVILFSLAMFNLLSHTNLENLWISAIAFVIAMVLSDFFSGIVHWMADTWGTYETPIFGPTFIRSFREHHLSPQAMTKHDIFETNGDNCLATLPVLYLMARKQVIFDGEWDYISFFNLSLWTWVCLWVALTNQIHAWAHTLNPPLIARVLQKCRLILSSEVHRKHHQMPFDKNYCITNGWAEPILNYFNFWKNAEYYITKYTGLIPRQDDMKWTGLADEEPETIMKLKHNK